ncbi:hypothetical protein IGI04_042671 [Brassica rapa subsp. trilocularis]|uniref:Anaphase-promoting complex subunit 1 n=1 Tax=Brassica rapa subsp. trilocularis TaxID=1813537 RepID=A0ABQ7KLJ3_BRACM|nr:hypothetical protein IGI04_042671 [Brassica rapa subsp. trilocularis]
MLGNLALAFKLVPACLKLSSLDQTLSKLLLAYPDSSWRVSLFKWMQGNFPSLLPQLPQ